MDAEKRRKEEIQSKNSSSTEQHLYQYFKADIRGEVFFLFFSKCCWFFEIQSNTVHVLYFLILLPLDSRNTVLHFLLLHFTISMLQERVEHHIKYNRDRKVLGWRCHLVVGPTLWSGQKYVSSYLMDRHQILGPDMNHIHTAAISSYLCEAQMVYGCGPGSKSHKHRQQNNTILPSD